MIYLGKLLEQNYNLLILLFVIIAVVGTLWLSFKNIPAGTLYVLLFVTLGIGLFSFITLLIKEDEAQYHLYLPFSSSYIFATTIFILGLILPLLLGAFHFTIVTQAFAPLVSFKSSPTAPTFELLQAQNDPFWTFFIAGFTAPVIEELVIGVFAVIIFVLVGYTIRKLLKLDFKNKNKYFDYSIGFIGSTLLFMLLHTFNQTYTDISMFLFAGFFRLIMNIAIWTLRFGAEFAIAFHSMTNDIYLGWASVAAGLFTLPGIIFIALFALIILFFVYNIKKVDNVWADYIKGFGRGEKE